MVGVESVLLPVHNGTVTLVPVPEEEEEVTHESIIDKIDANAPTPVPRARSSREFGRPLYVTKKSLPLFYYCARFSSDGLCIS